MAAAYINKCTKSGKDVDPKILLQLVETAGLWTYKIGKRYGDNCVDVALLGPNARINATFTKNDLTEESSESGDDDEDTLVARHINTVVSEAVGNIIGDPDSDDEDYHPLASAGVIGKSADESRVTGILLTVEYFNEESDDEDEIECGFFIEMNGSIRPYRSGGDLIYAVDMCNQVGKMSEETVKKLEAELTAIFSP